MAFENRLGGHSNSHHTYMLKDGIAAAGYKFVEWSALRGWSEHVPLEADAGTLGVAIEFHGEPWPAVHEVNRAMKASRDALVALGLG